VSSLDPIAEALAECAALSVDQVLALFERYARPLTDPEVALDPVVTLSDGETRIGRLQHRTPVDVIANDHFVMLAPGREPLAMPGPLFAAAVAALRRRALTRRE
jgi:hypothetical protein